MKRAWSLLIATVLLGGQAPAQPASAPVARPLANVNGEPITGADIQADFTRRHGGHQKFLMGASEVRSFLDIYIDDRLLVQEAYRLDLQDNESVKAAADEYATRKAVEHLLHEEIGRKSRVTEEEVRQAWERETTNLYLVRQIVVDTKQEADTIAFALASGGDFDKLARACSIDPSRLQGGQVDWLGWGIMDAAWEQEVFSLFPGETTPPFRTRDGWGIVQLGAVSNVDPPEFGSSRKRVEGILSQRKLEVSRKNLSELLRARYHVKFPAVELGPEELHAALSKSPDAPVATWDGGELTVGQFVKQVDWATLAEMPPGRFHTESEERLQDAVNAQLIRREAMARHYDEVPEVAAAARWYREDRMLAILYDQYMIKDLKVTDEDLRQYYEGHRSQFSSPEKRKVSHIVLPSLEQAQEVRATIVEGQSFAELAKTRSADTATAKRGGDLGWITAREAPGEFQAVFTLEEGVVSEPIQSRFGWHLFEVTGIEAPQPMPLAEAQPEVRKKVIEQKQREKRTLWVKRLRETATISVDNAGIQEFVQSNTPKS
jgi:parvulin-like peptidyl-prolyl isomerase